MANQTGPLITRSAVHAVLNTTRNAVQKGQALFLTPVAFAAQCAEPLPHHRPEVCDLACGSGTLLAATANDTTLWKLGLDITPIPQSAPPNPQWNDPHFIQGDLTLVAPLLDDMAWRSHLFALNPPRGLLWELERLAHLGQSDLPAVAKAFAELPNSSTHQLPNFLDSTLATFMLALHHCTDCGEGYLIANHASMERLIFAPGGPASPLAAHVWARITVAGNPMTGSQDNGWQGALSTDVIWFARGHTTGPTFTRHTANLGEWAAAVSRLAGERWRHLDWPELRPWMTETHIEAWNAVAEEWRNRQEPARTDWNLSLNAAGEIAVHLSTFDTEARSNRALSRDAGQLHILRGRKPMQVVLQRAQRDVLLRVAGPASPWHVQPELTQAVEAATREYHTARAPLNPLPLAQRLAYLDEQDTILCIKDFRVSPISDLPSPNYEFQFRAGERYPLSTWTIQVVRKGTRPNLQGELERLEFTGQELVICLEAQPEAGGEGGLTGRRRVAFVDPRMLTGDAEALDLVKGRRQVDACVPLTLFLDHFQISEVPDVSGLHSDQFKDHLAALDALEQSLRL